MEKIKRQIKITKKHYIIDGIKYYRVSTILRPITLEKYGVEAEPFLKEAQERGTRIHKGIETWHKEGENDLALIMAMSCGDNENEKKAINTYIELTKTEPILKNVSFTEKLVKDTINSSDGYSINLAGTIDIISGEGNFINIIDIKTRASLESKDNWLAERLQLLMYEKLAYLNFLEKVDIRKYILILSSKGEGYKLLEVKWNFEINSIYDNLLDIASRVSRWKGG